jgi:sulfopyruvate decarboxylase subunit beta
MVMTQQGALEAVVPWRGRRIVLATMSAAGIWPKLSNSPLDFVYLPSAMGHAPGLGLGLALAQPNRGVIIINGDGSMLMNLGSLVTLAKNPAPVYLTILDNGLYEVTGGQAHAGAGLVDFAQIARGAGIPRVYTFDSLDTWKSGAPQALAGQGPVVIWLKVEGRLGQKTPKAIMPMPEQVERFRQELLGERL